MVSLDSNLWNCETCGSIVRRDQIEGNCGACNNKTCIYCHRVCERCKRIFCMHHVEVKEVWRQGSMNRVCLCEICSKVW